MVLNYGNFEVRLARKADEVIMAQMLRYRVFVEEYGALVSKSIKRKQIECDEFDKYCDHLILIDKGLDTKNYKNKVVGTYRLLKEEVAIKNGGFYCQNEFDLSKIIGAKRNALEIGRSCIEKKYRGNIGLHLLWGGLGEYIVTNDIKILFGVASFYTQEIASIKEGLSLLHHRYLAREALRIRALNSGFRNMNMLKFETINQDDARRQIPSLIKGYLRLGGRVGEGAYIDRQFKTIDVSIIVETDLMIKKYKDTYGRFRK